MKLFNDNEVLIKCTQMEQLELVQLILKKGLPIHEDHVRYPIDNEFPFFIWDCRYFNCATSNESMDVVITYEEAKKEIEKYISSTIRLNEKYTAVVNENNITVGCQTITMDQFDLIAKSVEKYRSK